MIKNIKPKYIIIGILGLFLLWFFFLRTAELTITYDGVEKTTTSSSRKTYEYVESIGGYSVKSSNLMSDSFSGLSASNALDFNPVYKENNESEIYETPERYRENFYYRVDTEKFDNLITNLNKVIEEYKGIIKVNEQNSNRKKEYDREFYPRYQIIEFTVNNEVKDLSKIEETLKKFGNIRISNTSKTSIEQEIIDKQNRLKEIEAARKALQNSKDKEWITKRDSDYAKESEKIKSQIESAERQSTYKTYTINIYETIKFRINSVRYWYSHNYQLQNAIEDALPDMFKLLSILMPFTIMGIIIIIAFFNVFRNSKKKSFNDKIEALNHCKSKSDIKLEIKL